MKKFILKEDTKINKFAKGKLERYTIKKGSILISDGIKDEDGGVLCSLEIDGIKKEIILNADELIPKF